jgi:CubicO group peptidase (beta-lactamase class C family)
MKPQTPSFVLGLLGAMVYAAAAAAAPPVDWAAFDDPARSTKLATAYPQVDRVMREFVARENVPGAAWGIVVDGRLAHLGTTGLRDVEGARPVQGDSVFRIASMTKSFTAMAILKLRDEGKLSLDDPAERYVPELGGLRYPTDDAPRITLRHLLTHAAGFPEDNPWGDQQLGISSGRPVLESARRGVRVLQLRLRDPGPCDRGGVGDPLRAVHRARTPASARHALDDA